jgi:hypothetical protein
MGVISGDKEKILIDCQNESTSKTNSSFFLKFQVDSAPMIGKKIARIPRNKLKKSMVMRRKLA